MKGRPQSPQRRSAFGTAAGMSAAGWLSRQPGTLCGLPTPGAAGPVFPDRIVLSHRDEAATVLAVTPWAWSWLDHGDSLLCGNSAPPGRWTCPSGVTWSLHELRPADLEA